MISVSKHIRDVVVNIMSDQSTGFNATLTAVSDQYQIEPFLIDFSSISKNFYQGWYSSKTLDITTAYKCPLMLLYTIKSQNQNLEKFRVFSGAALMGLDIYLSFKKSAAIPDTETLGDAVEATLYNLFNQESTAALYGDVIFNGDISIQKGPLALADTNWLQLIQSRLSFDFNI